MAPSRAGTLQACPPTVHAAIADHCAVAAAANHLGTLGPDPLSDQHKLVLRGRPGQLDRVDDCGRAQNLR